jgi:hypothetical protein
MKYERVCEKFESIDAISEGNMPSWYRFQRNAGNLKILESDEYILEIHLKKIHFVSWRSSVILTSR